MTNSGRIASIKKTHPFKVWDLCVYSLIIVAVVLLLIAAAKPQGAVVSIQYYGADGQKAKITRRLDSDGAVGLQLENGKHCTIMIEGGKVWAEDSGCPDKVCIGMGKISRAGQQIICLPLKVIVTIEGEPWADLNIS